jgi:hypothetical protein
LEFTTYDQKPVSPCNDPQGLFYTVEERKSCSSEKNFSIINVGMFYNDVWAYKICNPASATPERLWDQACNDTGWEVWNVGAAEGGCRIELGIEV